MRLTHLDADGIKSLRNMDVAVAKLFALSGDNGSGKTAVGQVVKVGVLGHDPAIGKRLLDTRTELAADGEAFEVGLAFDSGFGIQRRIGKSMELTVVPSNGEKTDDQLQSRIEAELGTFILPLDLKSFTALTPEKRKEWLLNRLPRELATLAVDFFRRFLAYEEVDDITRRAIDHLWTEHVVKNASPVDGLAAAIEVAREKLNETDQARLAQVNVVSAADRDARLATEAAPYDPEASANLRAELSVAEQQIGEIHEQLAAAQRAEAAVREREHQRQALEIREREAAAAARQAAERLEQLRQAPAPDVQSLHIAAEHAARKARSQRDAVAYTRAELERAAAEHRLTERTAAEARKRLAEVESLQACDRCGSVEGIERVREVLRAEHEAAEAAVRPARQALDGAERAANEADAAQRGFDMAEAAARRALESAQQLRAQLERAQAELSRHQEAQRAAEGELLRLKELAPIVVPTDVPDVRPLQEQAVALREQLRAQEAAAKEAGKAERAREYATEQRAKLEDLAARVDRLKSLHRGLQKLRAQVIQQMVEPVEQHAQDLLRRVDPAKTFRFVFEREGRPACDFGFEQQGTFRSFKAASGGEQALLAVVFIAAMMDTVKPRWRVLMIDAAEALDRGRRRALMQAIAELQDHFDNVFLNGCCEFDAVEGWTIREVREITQARPAAAA